MLSLHCRSSLGFRPALWHVFGLCVNADLASVSVGNSPVPVSDNALTKDSNFIPNESLLLP